MPRLQRAACAGHQGPVRSSCQDSCARGEVRTLYAQVMAAERAGAEAVLVFNSIPDGEPSGGLMEMGGDGGAELPSIPAVLVSQVRTRLLSFTLRDPVSACACDLDLCSACSALTRTYFASSLTTWSKF